MACQHVFGYSISGGEGIHCMFIFTFLGSCFLKGSSNIVLSNIIFKQIWLIDGTLTGTITLGQSGHGNNGNEGVLQISKTGASPSNAV